MVGLPEISEFGWNPDGSIIWVEECFPAEVEDIMGNLFSYREHPVSLTRENLTRVLPERNSASN